MHSLDSFEKIERHIAKQILLIGIHNQSFKRAGEEYAVDCSENWEGELEEGSGERFWRLQVRCCQWEKLQRILLAEFVYIWRLMVMMIIYSFSVIFLLKNIFSAYNCTKPVIQQLIVAKNYIFNKITPHYIVIAVINMQFIK